MSAYLENIGSQQAKSSYLAKLNRIDLSPETQDPFDDKFGGWTDQIERWPPVTFGDIYTYLIDRPGPYTQETLKAYKSLEAYNQFSSGWVQTVYSQHLEGRILLKGNVLRSQATTNKPHAAWVSVKKDGTIEAAHCTCMAGLGEVCSHMASILFKVEAAVRMGLAETACTSKLCEWNQTFVKKVAPAEIGSMRFYKPKRGKENYKIMPTKKLKVADPTSLLSVIQAVNPTAVIFTITSPREPDKNKISKAVLPKVLTSLANEEDSSLSSEQLKTRCEEVMASLAVTTEQAAEVEKRTRSQSDSRYWQTYRCGRITASYFKQVCSTSLENVSVSLLASIMQYKAVSSQIPAIKWGKEKEEVAAAEYFRFAAPRHDNLTMSFAGLVLHPDYPYLGATPDRRLMCDCCGEGVMEVKCPFKWTTEHPCSVDNRDFCLLQHTVDPNGFCSQSLKRTHPYYYQVQGQMALCDVRYCDFVCWTPKGLHIERIVADPDFFRSIVTPMKQYFTQVLLPELLTRKRDPSLATETDLILPVSRDILTPQNQNKVKKTVGVKKSTRQKAKSAPKTVFCVCGKDEDFDDMIGCDAPNCEKEWYHYSCMGLTLAPKGDWICPACM